MNGGRLRRLMMPDEDVAALQLADFVKDHGGVTVLAPGRGGGRWQAAIDKGTVPGDGPETIRHLTALQPSGLLGKLRDLFPAPAPGPG